MKWFKKNHIVLYNRYKLHFRVPERLEQVQANLDYVEPADKQKLQDAISQYYEVS